MYNKIIKDLEKLINTEKAKLLSGFFKTKKGEYGEGDIFLGITVPNQRNIAKKYYKETQFEDLKKLLKSQIHEHRLTGAIICVIKYEKSTNLNEQEKIAKFYIENRKGLNNWDIIDVTAPKILGPHLINKDKSILYKFAKSKNLWEKRISILTTFFFIKNNQFKDSIKISEILLNDSHDLIHKAVGWMLREIGKKDQKIEEEFLKKHYKKMPRTMLRYSIEKFPEELRQKYLKGKI